MTKTNDFLGLPLFRRLYGFGDVVTLRAKMTTAFLGNVDRKALAGALPQHPMVHLHPLSPLMLVQSEFDPAIDNADPLGDRPRYRELMLCVLLRHGVVSPMFPLILFVDQPTAILAGREYHGFPKVPAELTYTPTGGTVRCATYPKGEAVFHDVLRTEWSQHRGLLARAFDAVEGALSSAAEKLNIDRDTIDTLTAFAMKPGGEVWNLRQVPDLANPHRAVFSQLTRFKPKVTEIGNIDVIDGFKCTLPDEPMWELRRRFFAGEPPKTWFAFQWEATMTAFGAGDVIDSWTPERE